ncbi:MAG: lycopene cyclase domain-containing protein [Crocinitomicaceae bacterium]
MSLYLILMLASFGPCFLLSFDKKVAFFKNMRFFVPAVFAVAIPFLIWDQYFTINGVWGFNESYLQGIFIGSLPLEEVLFFFVIPYCCVFIYEVLIAYFPNASLNNLTKMFSLVFVLSGTLLALMNLENWYTLSACSRAVMCAVFAIRGKYIWYPRVIFAFVVAQLPFLIVNGVLTGAATPEPIVWYSEFHITGVRILTIPVEDVFYNFSLLMPIIALYHYFKLRFHKISR